MNRILLAMTLLTMVTAQPAAAQALPTNQDLHASLHMRPDQERLGRPTTK